MKELKTETCINEALKSGIFVNNLRSANACIIDEQWNLYNKKPVVSDCRTKAAIKGQKQPFVDVLQNRYF